MGEDEEDKRALLPEYSRNMDFIPIGKDADGFPILYAVSNIDPVGPLTDLIRAARRGDDPLDAVWDQFKENYIAPAIAGRLFDAAAITTNEYLGWRVPTINGRPRKPLVQQWSPEGWLPQQVRWTNSYSSTCMGFWTTRDSLPTRYGACLVAE